MVVITVCRAFEFMSPDDANIVLPHQPPDPAFTNDAALIPELISHSLATIGPIITGMLGTNMGQIDPVVALALTGRASHPSVVAAFTDPQDFAHPAD